MNAAIASNPKSTAAPVAVLRGVTLRFDGLTALADINIEVTSGEIMGIIGPNGAGKTALINVISGFYVPSEGRVQIEGTDLTGRHLYRFAMKGVARTFQNLRLFKRMTVLENVLAAEKRYAVNTLSAFLGFSDRKAQRNRAMGYLERLGLAHRADQLAGILPYGEARRLEIARALAGDPVLLLLDEPAAGMNAEESAALARDIRLCRDLVRAIVVIEHDLALIEALATRLIVLDAGRLIAEGTLSQVLSDARVRTAYLGAEDVG